MLPKSFNAIAGGVAGVFILVATSPTAAFQSATVYRANPVRGATPAELVEGMRAAPLPNIPGLAFASINDRYEMALDTRMAGGRCAVARVSVDFRFTITLPAATDEARMSARTRSAWRGFVAYLRRHEEGHRAIFLSCASAFEAAARRLRSAAGCASFKSDVVSLLERHYRACLIRQQAYDRRESARLLATPLMRAARFR